MTTDHEQAEREIYVGYLPMSPRERRFTRTLVALLVLVGLASGAIIAHALRPAGAGAWNTSETITLTGTLRLAPYPHLVTPEGAVLLAEPGKFGPQSRLASLNALEVRLTGTLLTRGSWRALEITSHESLGVTAASPSSLSLAPEAVTLRGEILDSKCFLGAMKPGDGLTHKACAILCLRGGIAPLFVGQDASGRTYAAVLCTPDLTPISDTMISLAGEPIVAMGQIGSVGPLPVFVVSESSIAPARD